MHVSTSKGNALATRPGHKAPFGSTSFPSGSIRKRAGAIVPRVASPEYTTPAGPGGIPKSPLETLQEQLAKLSGKPRSFALVSCRRIIAGAA